MTRIWEGRRRRIGRARISSVPLTLFYSCNSWLDSPSLPPTLVSLCLGGLSSPLPELDGRILLRRMRVRPSLDPLVFRGNRMIAAVSSPASSHSVRDAFFTSNVGGLNVSRPRLERRQQRQRFLEWDRDEPREEGGDARRPAANCGVAPAASLTERASNERSSAGRSAAGPRRMGDVMPDVLARYGL
jgi:hypothetical protein